MKLTGVLLLFIFVRPVAMFAQNVEVNGAVQDSSGAAIAKASVEFRNQDTGVHWQTSTNHDGLYNIGEIDPGNYDATVQAKGFKTLTREGIAIQAGRKAQVDFKMEVEVAAYGATVPQAGIHVNDLEPADIAENPDRRLIVGRSTQTIQSGKPTSGTELTHTVDAAQMDKECKPVHTGSFDSKL